MIQIACNQNFMYFCISSFKIHMLWNGSLKRIYYFESIRKCGSLSPYLISSVLRFERLFQMVSLELPKTLATKGGIEISHLAFG